MSTAITYIVLLVIHLWCVQRSLGNDVSMAR